MITPEFIEYIREEFAKGRTQKEIRETLLSGGKWTEAELDEVFGVVIPMQGFDEKISFQNVLSGFRGSFLKKIVLFYHKGAGIFLFTILFSVCLISLWSLRAEMVPFWDSLVKSIKNPYINNNLSFIPPSNTPILKQNSDIKDCGITNAPDFKNPNTYRNDSVLNCLGERSLHCENAKATLVDTLFPTIFQVVNNSDSCNFILSYASDSQLHDITGRALANQYIICPVGIVKRINESIPNNPTFEPPTKTDLGKYASEIYFYGTIGLFMENDVSKDRVEALGCHGSYIDSVVASYKQLGKKN